MTQMEETFPLDVRKLAKLTAALEGLEGVAEPAIASAIMRDREVRNAPDTGGAWRPIETAPKDEKWKRPELLLWDGRRLRVGRWNADEYAKKPRPFWAYNGSLGKTDDRANQPTHWMPLPASPGFTATASPASGVEIQALEWGRD